MIVAGWSRNAAAAAKHANALALHDPANLCERQPELPMEPFFVQAVAGHEQQLVLLAAGKRSDRARLAKATGISEKLILTWVNHGDLMRVTGAGPEYARLLERAGVDTVPELAKRRADNLAASFAKANDLGGGKVAVKRLPDETSTTKWIANAKNFVRMVTYESAAEKKPRNREVPGQFQIE